MDHLPDRPFHVSEALPLGITRRQLEGRRYRRLFRGVYVDAVRQLSWHDWVVAAVLVAPKDAVASHITAARLWNLDIPADRRIHLSTRTTAITAIGGIVLHRRRATISTRDHDGLPVTGPERTFVDCAAMRSVSFVWLVALAEHLIHLRLTDLATLAAYCHDRHLDGVRRARRVMTRVREGAESPMESLVRMMLIFARLPEPACNVDLFSAAGRFLGRGDLVYAAFKVLVEYDGQWHERTADQRRNDRDRRERLEADGWIVIVLYDTDLQHPATIATRVHAALVRRGHAGPAPITSEVWTRWFTR